MIQTKNISILSLLLVCVSLSSFNNAHAKAYDYYQIIILPFVSKDTIPTNFLLQKSFPPASQRFKGEDENEYRLSFIEKNVSKEIYDSEDLQKKAIIEELKTKTNEDVSNELLLIARHKFISKGFVYDNIYHYLIYGVKYTSEETLKKHFPLNTDKYMLVTAAQLAEKENLPASAHFAGGVNPTVELIKDSSLKDFFIAAVDNKLELQKKEKVSSNIPDIEKAEKEKDTLITMLLGMEELNKDLKNLEAHIKALKK